MFYTEIAVEYNTITGKTSRCVCLRAVIECEGVADDSSSTAEVIEVGGAWKKPASETTCNTADDALDDGHSPPGQWHAAPLQ